MTASLIERPPTEEQLAAIDTETLRAQLSRQLEITAEHVARLALIWRELERRGEDLSSLRSGLASYLPAVASGRLVPEAVVRLAGNKSALRTIAMLAPDEQRRLLASGTVAVASMTEGTRTVRQVPLHLLTPNEAARVIDPVAGTTRPADAQVIRHRGRSNTPTNRIVVMLTSSQHGRLHTEAKRANTSINTLVIKTLRESGLLE